MRILSTMKFIRIYFVLIVCCVCNVVHAEADLDKYSGLKPEKLLKKGIYVCDINDVVNNTSDVQKCKYLLSSGGYDGSHTYLDLESSDFQNNIVYITINLPKKASIVSKTKVDCATHQLASIATWKFEGYFQTGRLLEAENSTDQLVFMSADPGSLFENSLSMYCFLKGKE